MPFFRRIIQHKIDGDVEKIVIKATSYYIVIQLLWENESIYRDGIVRDKQNGDGAGWTGGGREMAPLSSIHSNTAGYRAKYNKNFVEELSGYILIDSNV